PRAACAAPPPPRGPSRPRPGPPPTRRCPPVPPPAIAVPPPPPAMMPVPPMATYQYAPTPMPMPPFGMPAPVPPPPIPPNGKLYIVELKVSEPGPGGDEKVVTRPELMGTAGEPGYGTRGPGIEGHVVPRARPGRWL